MLSFCFLSIYARAHFSFHPTFTRLNSTTRPSAPRMCVFIKVIEL